MAKELEPKNKMVGMIRHLYPDFINVLPDKSPDNVESFKALTELEIRENKNLQKCTDASVASAIKKAWAYGMPFNDTEGHCYIIPYKNEAKFQLGYKGLLELCLRSGEVSAVYAHVIYENDSYSIELGTDKKLAHKPVLTDKGDPIAYYCVIHLENGMRLWDYMTHKEMLAHEKKCRKGGKQSDAWAKWWEAMALKTVFIKTAKWAPRSVFDNRFLKAMDEDKQDFIDIQAEDTQVTSADELAEKLDAKQAEVVTEAPFESMATVEELEVWIQEYTTENDIPDKVVSDACIESGVLSGKIEDANFEQLTQVCQLIYGEKV